jgi:hypothetical protein
MGVRSIATLLLLGLAALSLGSRATAQTNDIAVIVSADNPATNVSMGELRKMFAGAKRPWPGGQRIKLVTRGPGCP